jgi:phage baseplate assembly protein W
MSAPRYRAFRFVLPRPGAGLEHPGLRLTSGGGLAMVDEDASVRQAILLLLSTRPGERVMRPGYGCDLERLVFSPNDDTTAGLAIHYVRRALATWEPRIDLLRVDAGRSPEDPSRLEIVVEYRVRATQRRDRLTTHLALDGGTP